MCVLNCLKRVNEVEPHYTSGYVFDYEVPCIIELTTSGVIMQHITDHIIITLRIKDKKTKARAKVISKDLANNKLYVLPEKEILLSNEVEVDMEI